MRGTRLQLHYIAMRRQIFWYFGTLAFWLSSSHWRHTIFRNFFAWHERHTTTTGRSRIVSFSFSTTAWHKHAAITPSSTAIGSQAHIRGSIHASSAPVSAALKPGTFTVPVHTSTRCTSHFTTFNTCIRRASGTLPASQRQLTE